LVSTIRPPHGPSTFNTTALERSAKSLQQTNEGVNGTKSGLEKPKLDIKALENHDVYFSSQSSRAKLDRFLDEETQRTMVLQFEAAETVTPKPFVTPPLALVLEKFPQPSLRVGFQWQEVDPVYRLQKILFSPIPHQALMMKTFGFDSQQPVILRPFHLKPIIRVEATQEFIPMPEVSATVLAVTEKEPAPDSDPKTELKTEQAASAETGILPAVFPQPALGVKEHYHPIRDKVVSFIRRFLPDGKLGPLHIFENGDIHFMKWTFNPIRYWVDELGRRVKVLHMAQLDQNKLVDVHDAVTIPLDSQEGTGIRKAIKETVLNEMTRIESQGYRLKQAGESIPGQLSQKPELTMLPGGPTQDSPAYGENPFKLAENKTGFKPKTFDA
jgi:hypothetical protein